MIVRETTGTVYLDHFDRPIGNADNRRAMAQHYIGWAEDVDARHAEHRNGTGARILAACVQRGVGFSTVRTWKGVDRHFERALKNRKNARALCPVCCAAAVAVAENCNERSN